MPHKPIKMRKRLPNKHRLKRPPQALHQQTDPEPEIISKRRKRRQNPWQNRQAQLNQDALNNLNGRLDQANNFNDPNSDTDNDNNDQADLNTDPNTNTDPNLNQNQDQNKNKQNAKLNQNQNQNANTSTSDPNSDGANNNGANDNGADNNANDDGADDSQNEADSDQNSDSNDASDSDSNSDHDSNSNDQNSNSGNDQANNSSNESTLPTEKASKHLSDEQATPGFANAQNRETAADAAKNTQQIVDAINGKGKDSDSDKDGSSKDKASSDKDGADKDKDGADKDGSDKDKDGSDKDKDPSSADNGQDSNSDDKDDKDKDSNSDDKDKDKDNDKDKDSDDQAGKGPLAKLKKLKDKLNPLKKNPLTKFKDFLKKARDKNRKKDDDKVKRLTSKIAKTIQRIYNFMKAFTQAMRAFAIYRTILLVKAALGWLVNIAFVVGSFIVTVASSIFSFFAALTAVVWGWIVAGITLLVILAIIIIMAIFQSNNDDKNKMLSNLYDSICATDSSKSSKSSDSGSSSSGTKAGSWATKGTKFYNNAKQVAKKLESMGFSGNAIAGIMGNMAQESSFNTAVLNGLGDGGKGLMQWTHGRRTELENFAKSKGMSSSSLKLQLLMMEHDLKNPLLWVSSYKHISPKILNDASSPADAAARFYLSGFEAGGGNATDPDGSQPNRENFAKQAYSIFHLSGIKGSDSKMESLIGGATQNGGTTIKDVADSAKEAFCKIFKKDASVSGKWVWPFATISNKNKNPKWYPEGNFGNVRSGEHPFHDGFDFSRGINDVHNGQTMRAVTAGKIYKIAYTNCSTDYKPAASTQSNINEWWFVWEKAGKYNIIYQEGFDTKHDISVKEGQTVKAGQKIGILGATRSHMHLGITKRNIKFSVENGYSPNGGWLNPIKVIDAGLNGHGKASSGSSKSSGSSGGSSGSSSSGSAESARKWIINKESGGNYKATNGQYKGAYQLTSSYLSNPKYHGNGSMSKTNQDRVAYYYMKDNYGSWQKAKQFWQGHGWW